MQKIVLLSDTHSHIDDKMLKFIEPADMVIHAGDVGNVNVLNQLQNYKPTVAVFGNIDDAEMRTKLPQCVIFNIEDVKVLMTHIGGYPGQYSPGIAKKIREEKPQLFISGHSHILKVMFDKQLNCMHMNPGAAGLFGFHMVRTMLRFTIDGNKIENLEFWEMPKNHTITNETSNGFF